MIVSLIGKLFVIYVNNKKIPLNNILYVKFFSKINLVVTGDIMLFIGILNIKL